MTIYKQYWDALEQPSSQPNYCRDIREFDYKEFAESVRVADPSFAKSIVESLYAGDVLILRNAWTESFMRDLAKNTFAYWQKSEPSFHKVLEGCIDFHRIIDPEVAKNYTFKSIRHSTYFFPWNDDPLGIYESVMQRWRICKLVSGFDEFEYENHTPKDGIVDRTQVALYPPEFGCSERHADPWQNQRIFISGFMSKKGVDFEEGGFYVVNANDEEIDCELQVEIGDLVIGYATVQHGVATVDPHKKCDWTSADGRWWLGLYSISSNEVSESERAVGHAVK